MPSRQGPVCLSCRAGQLWVVAGETGCGKTSLLLGLRGETHRRGGGEEDGEEEPPSRPYAFCPQQPYMHTGSVRSNIIMNSAFDADKYAAIVAGCGLDRDFQVRRSTLP